MTQELARSAVEAAVHRYCTDRRARIPEFVDRHFSLRGAVAVHRAALGWDILRTPFNLTMAAPAAGLHLAAMGARRLGSQRVARVLASKRLLLPTAGKVGAMWVGAALGAVCASSGSACRSGGRSSEDVVRWAACSAGCSALVPAASSVWRWI